MHALKDIFHVVLNWKMHITGSRTARHAQALVVGASLDSDPFLAIVHAAQVSVKTEAGSLKRLGT